MFLIVLTAMVLSVELIFALTAILAQVPIPVNPAFLHSIVPCYQRTFKPQRDLFLYGLWMVLGIMIYTALMVAIRKFKLKQKWDVKPFLTIHAVLLFLMGHAAFEVVTMDNPVWAWPVFWTAFALAMGMTIFWPEFVSSLSFLKGRCRLKIKPWLGAVVGCIFVFLVVFMPDLKAVVALVYMGEYFHNWDVQLFGAIYGVSQGLMPGVQVMTTYAFGAPVILAKLVNLMGGFDYVKLMGIIMWMGIIYFCLWFLLMRRFLASTLLGFAAIVFAMRMEMFHLLIEPFVWAVVMASIFRYFFDALVFWMVWKHIQTRRMVFLAGAGFLVSVCLFYMLTTGTYMCLMLGLYVIASAFLPALGGGGNRLLWRNHALVLVGTLLLAGLWFFLTVGTNMFHGWFWFNVVEYNSYFVRGIFSDLPTTPLVRHNYVMGITGFLVPVLYLTTFLYVVGLIIEKKVQPRDVLASLLAFYGLEIHSYYMVIASQWYSVGLPAVFLTFYWITKMLDRAPVSWRKPVAWGLVMAALFCLLTDRLFTGYPNLLNISRNPITDPRTAFIVGPQHNIPYFHETLTSYPEAYKIPLNSIGRKDEELKFATDFTNDQELEAYYDQQTAWPEDTALIDRLTPEGSRVPILSSFEIMLLKNAHRKPFFYYFPMLNSMPLTSRVYMVTGLFSYPQVIKVLDQMEAEKPPYIFMERKFLNTEVPQAYLYDYPDLIALLQYVLSKYQPVETGKYLVAMKRK